MLYDDWHVFRWNSFTHALHSAHPSPLGRTIKISAAAGGPWTALRPGSHFKRQARLARLLAGPPGNNAQGGNICTLSPGGSQSFPFRCMETEDAPIRGPPSHRCSLKGEICPFTCGEARQWLACRTPSDTIWLSDTRLIVLTCLSGFWSPASSEDNATCF